MPPILCPNQSTPEWKELVSALREEFGGKSEELAHLAFQRNIMAGGKDIPIPTVARELLASRAADESAPQLGSYSVAAPVPMPEDAVMHSLASEFLGDRPEKEYDPSMQKGVSDARFASGNLAPVAAKLFFATRSSAAFDPKGNFGVMMEYLRDRADTSLDLDAFATTLKRHFGKLAGAETAGEIADAVKDGTPDDAPPKDEATDPAGLNRALSEADEDRAMKMVEFNPTARLASLFADDKMMPGSRSFASFVDAMRAAKRRESPNEPEIDVRKLPAWLDGPRSSESLVSYFQDFLKGLSGTFADGSRDLGPAYHFLAQFNGGYGNRATSIFELSDNGGKPGYLLREQHDSAPAVNLSKLPAAAAEHLSNPENVEALYHFLVGDGYTERVNGRDVQRPPVFRRGIDPKTGEKSNAAKAPSVPTQDSEGKINDDRFRQPSYDQNSFLLDNLQKMSEEAMRRAEGQDVEARKGGPRAAEYRAAAERLRRMTTSELDQRQRRSLVKALERVLGEQPPLRSALLNELTIASTSGGRDKPFFYAAKVVENMLWDVGQLISAHRQKANPNLARDASLIVRRYLMDQKAVKKGTVGGGSDRSQFELLLGSLSRKGTAKNPVRADGSKMAAAGFVGPIEERLRSSSELKKHLAEKLGYSAAEIRELEATGRYRDGTPLVMFDGGTRGEFKGQSYQKTPDKRHIEDMVSALEHTFTNPGRGVSSEFATFWTDQADSNKRLLFNLPRSMVSTESYGKAWDDAQKVANGAVANVPAKYRKQFTDAQGTKPLEGVPGGLPSKIKLAVILGRVNADGTLDPSDGKFLDGTLLQDPQLAEQERRSFGTPEGTMNKTHVIDAIGGKTFVKAATQYVVTDSKSPGNPLLDLHAAVGKALGFESYELTDTGGAKFFESQGTKDVAFGDSTYRVGYTEYPASFKRRTTELESSSKPHEVKLAAQDITDMASLAGGEQHYRSAVNASRAARAMRLASESDPSIRLTPEDTARMLKSSDASALAAELARQQYDPQDTPLFVDEIAQHRIASVLDDAQVMVNGMHLVQRASAGGMDGDQARWLGGKADAFVTDSYMHGPDGLIVPLIRTNDNDPTSRTGYWLRGTPEDFASKVTLHVLAMRAGNTRDGMRLKAELNEMLVDTMGQTPHLKASFDDLVDADGKFDKAAIYKMGKSEHAPKGSHPDGLYVGGTLYHDVSRSPGTTMASHWPARRSEPVAWVERTRRSSDPTKPNETYWGTAEANESVVHPRLVRAAGTDNDGDKWLVSVQYKDPKTGVAYRAEDTSPEEMASAYRSELDAEFAKNPEKYGKKNQTTLDPAQVAARRSFAEQRFSHYKRVLGNQVLLDGYSVFKAEAAKRSGQTLFGTRMMPEIGLKPFGENGEKTVPHLNSGANSAIAKFNKDVSADRRAKIDSRLAGDGVTGNLESLTQKTGYVDIPYWLHIEIANGAGEEASADAAARRAAMNQESNQARGVAVAGVRNMNQAVRLPDARFTIPEHAILDDSGNPIFGELTRGTSTLTEAEKDRSNQLVDDFLCSIVNLNIDAMKAPMPEMAPAFMTSSWTSLEIPLLAAHTFKTPEEVLAFHTKFMKFAQGRFGQAYYETMRERNSVSRAEILDNDEALVSTEENRLNSRIRAAYVSLHPGDSAGAAKAAKAFATLRNISDNIRTADSVANAHKGNLGYAQRLARLGDSIEGFEKMLSDEPGKKAPDVRLANKEVAGEVRDRANELRGIGNDFTRNSPNSRLPGHFGRTLADAINERRAGDASIRDEAETYTRDSLHALGAVSLLPADLLQRANSKPDPVGTLLSLAEAAIHKAYSEQTGNHLLQGLQTPEPSRKVISRMSGRDNSLALDKVGLEPYWEAARNMNGVRLGTGDTHFPFEEGANLSAKDMEHLMFFYSSAVHGANFRGKNGGFLRLLSPEVHQRVGDAVRKFSTSAPFAKQSDVADRMATLIGAKQMRVLDPVRGTRVLRIPLDLESGLRGVEQKIRNEKAPEVVSKEQVAKPAEQKRVVLEGTSPYLAKDQLKADLATKFIGRGSAASSTARYARTWGDRANSGKYDASDRVFISAEGARSTRVAPDFVEVQRALDARATIITDDVANRSRSYNSGEREVAEYLTAHGYAETKPGTWTPTAPKRETARVIEPAVETSGGGFVRGTSHAEALKEAFPLMSGEQIEKIRNSGKAKFMVADEPGPRAEKHGKTEVDADENGAVWYLVSRKEAMEIAKQAAQLRDGFGNETELHSHMLEREDPGSYSVVDPEGKDERMGHLREMDAQSMLHKMVKADGFSRYEHGNLPGWLTWENMRRYWRQWSLRSEGQWGKKPLSTDEIQWLADRSDFHDQNIWNPILSAPDYETAVTRFNAIKTWPSLDQARGAQMQRQVRELMDFNPPKKWEEHRLEQVRKNEEGVQARYDELMSRYIGLTDAEKELFHKAYEAKPEDILKGLFQAMRLAGAEKDPNNNLEQRFKTVLDIAYAARKPEQVELDLGVQPSPAEQSPEAPSYSVAEPDPDVKAAQLSLPGFPEADSEAVRVKNAAKPAANTFSITASDEQRRLAEAALAPLGLQEDTPNVSLPKGIVLPPSGKKADVIGGTVDGDMADWKKETFVDPHEYMRSMLSYQMQLDGPNSLFRVVENWKNWAQHGATAARYTVKAMRDLLGLADSTGRLSNMIEVERPVVDTDALAEPGAPMTTGETETAQARGRMGFVAPWKGAGGKVGQAKQLDENERRLAYWTDLVIASWAAGPKHQTIPLSITIPNIESPVDQMKAISAALKKTQEGKNPLPTEIATLLRQELANGNTSLTVLTSRQAGKTVLAVPVDLVEKAFMGSSYRAKLIETGRSEKMLTREGLTKMAKDHFASEYTRISGTSSFLLDGEDGFASALRQRQNYVPLRHGTGPVAHAVDKLERELNDLIDPSAKVSEEARRVETEYGHWLAPGQATVDSSAYGLTPGTRVPKSIYETPEWAMQRLHELLAKEDNTLFRDVPNRSNFITDLKEGAYEKFGLSKDSGYAEVLRALEAANMRLLMRRKLNAEELHSPEDGYRPVELARALRTQLRGMPGEEPSFTKARAFETHQEAWEVAGLLPSSMSFTDLVADYGNRQMSTMARRMILNQLLLATDIQGNPLVTALPNLEFKDSSSVIADQTWEHVARKWAEHFKTPYDEAKTGKENAHRIVTANVIGQSSDKFTDRFGRRTQYVVVPTAYSSVSQWYAQQGRPDETRVVDMLIGGEAAEALKHTMETADLWETNRIMSGLQDVNQWMKLNALQMSFFHYKALIEDIESATWGKAILPKAIMAKDPSHIALGEWIRMLRTNDPYVKELTRVMDEVGITQSYGSVNPADIALGKTEQGIEKMGSWMSKHMGDRWGKDFQAIAESLTGEQSTFLFEELNNVAKLMVVHTLLQKGRMAAYKAGRPFDPVAAMRPYNRYVNEAVGGLNPSHYSWATPRVRQMLNLGLFSWQWTAGAWNAAGGQLLTGGLINSKLTPEAQRFIFKRRLPAMIALVLVAEPVVAQLGSYLAASAFGKTTDDDHAWMWDNEEGKKTYADITPFAKMMPWWQGDKMSNNKNRRLYARWGKQIHELMGWLDDPVKTAGGKSSLALQTAWGLATGRSMGTDWNLGFKNEGLVGWVSGRHGFEDSRLAYAGKNIVPVLGSFSVSQVLRNPDAGLLGLVGPTSRGTSYHVATQRAQVILSAWAESDHYRTFQNNQKIQTNLHALLADVLDDARANGYNAEDVLNASRKAILKAKYADMYAAVNSGDHDAMERAAREILRLNGTVEGVRASTRNRNRIYGKSGDLTPEESKAVSEAFHEPELKRLQAERKAAQPKKPKPADQFAALRDYLDKKQG